MKIMIDGIERDATAAEIAELEAARAGSDILSEKTKVYKADVWRRASDAEAIQIDALLKAQPVRIQRLWDDAQFLMTTDELFGQVYTGAVSLFGPDRASELLTPTE